MLLKTEATAILKRTQLPAIAQAPLNEDNSYFTNEDILKIIDHIINKGNKYSQLKKSLEPEEIISLEKKMINSSYIVTFV